MSMIVDWRGSPDLFKAADHAVDLAIGARHL